MNRFQTMLKTFGVCSLKLASGLSFRRKPESRITYWIPCQARNDAGYPAARSRALHSLFVLILLVLFAPVVEARAQDSLSATLDGLRKKYGRLPGLEVTYRREIITRSMAMLGEHMKGDLASGKIYFKPPHFLKVQQETPTPEAVITDGNTLWWYIPQKKQVHRYPSKRLGPELRLLADVFQGLKGVEEGFVVMLKGTDEKGGIQLELTPNPPWPEVHHINLTVGRGDYQIRVVEIHNTIGGITRFIITHLGVQEGLNEKFFRFEIPEGVKVLEE